LVLRGHCGWYDEWPEIALYEPTFLKVIFSKRDGSKIKERLGENEDEEGRKEHK
jgi:hypothetical protein